MSRTPIAIRVVFAGLLVTGGFTALGNLAFVRSRLARASGATSASPAATSCRLSGKTFLMWGTPLYRDASGGAALARVNTAERGIEIDTLPDDTQAGRAHFTKLTYDKPTIRMTGWIDAKQLHLAASHDLKVFGDHILFPKGRPIVAKLDASGHYSIELANGQFIDLHIPGGCADLQIGTLAGPTYTNKSPKLLGARSFDFFESATGASVRLTRRESYPLEVDDLGGTGAFRHVHYVAEEILDGWVRAAELAPVKPDTGDTFGVGGLGLTGTGAGGGAATAPRPKEIVTASEIEVRDAEGAGGRLVGMLEKGARIRIFPGKEGVRIELVDGSLLPAKDGGFWVKKVDVGM